MIANLSSLQRALLLAGAAAAVAFAGCESEAELNFRHNKDGKGTPVATFGGDSITAEELKERFAEMSPFARAGYESLDKKKEYVDGLARFELLAAEAYDRGLHKDPEVVETAKKVMVQKLIQKEFDEKPTPVSDAEVAEYYEKNKAEYVKPEMVRLSYIFVSAGADPKERAEKKAKAQKLVEQARAMQPLDYGAFAQLAAENTDHEKTKPLKGDLRYLSNEDVARELGPELAAAATQLTQMGQVSDVIEMPTGFHILKLQGRQKPLNLGVEQVKTQIQSKLLHERRAQMFNAYIDQLKKRANFKIDEKALGAVEIDLKAPPKDSKRPPPGYIPSVAGVQ